MDQNYAYADENWVEVEQMPFTIDKDSKDKKIKFLDYRDRRQLWNFRFTFFGVKSDLSDYALSTTQLASSLKSDGTGFEAAVSLSYNIGVLSAGLDLGLLNSKYKGDVSLLQPKGSIHVIADNLFKNPYFVPYFKIGASQMSFTNPNTSDIAKINSDISIFYAFGGMIALDWFQKTLAMDAYFNYGLDATFLVIEFENFSGIPASNVDGLPDIKQSNTKIGLQLVF